jgi:hypothetical protein
MGSPGSDAGLVPNLLLPIRWPGYMLHGCNASRIAQQKERRMKVGFQRCAAAAALALGAQVTAAQLVEPTRYLSFADSPFGGLAFSWFELDDFESPTRTPGYSVNAGIVLNPGSQTDSVDADDGAIDGSGTAGRSWFSNGTTNVFTFTFDAGVRGLPTHAGIVWTDVGATAAGTSGTSLVHFEAFGPAFATLSPLEVVLGDGNAEGGTDEDRFFGAADPGGVAIIRITMPVSTDWEVDHLQYGALAPVPEPEQWLLMALGLGALGWRMHKGRGSTR